MDDEWINIEGESISLKETPALLRELNLMPIFLKKYYDTDNLEIHSSDENEKIVCDVITLAKNNNIKKIILEDLVDGVASDLKKKIQIRSVRDLSLIHI